MTTESVIWFAIWIVALAGGLVIERRLHRKAVRQYEAELEAIRERHDRKLAETADSFAKSIRATISRNDPWLRPASGQIQNNEEGR